MKVRDEVVNSEGVWVRVIGWKDEDDSVREWG